jgi:hypothetical protein
MPNASRAVAAKVFKYDPVIPSLWRKAFFKARRLLSELVVAM